MGTGRQHDEEFKKQAVKLGMEAGNKAAVAFSCCVINSSNLTDFNRPILPSNAI